MLERLRFIVRLFSAILITIGMATLLRGILLHPGTPVPREWNPLKPLVIADPVTGFTGRKLRQAVADPALCQAVLQDSDAGFRVLPDLEVNAKCYIRARVSLSRVGGTELNPVETNCAMALRLAMWEQHSLQPLAVAHFGQRIAEVLHLQSYNCRPIRGSSTRMSKHATADAIDVSGFRLADGHVVSLLEGWGGPDGAFWRDVRDSACDWFVTVLSPDYNALHADHFHLQNRGWHACR